MPLTVLPLLLGARRFIYNNNCTVIYDDYNDMCAIFSPRNIIELFRSISNCEAWFENNCEA